MRSQQSLRHESYTQYTLCSSGAKTRHCGAPAGQASCDTASQRRNRTTVQKITMSSIRRVVAVTSCKGGVGKSTVSLALARRLAKRGARVGLFDADVHGP